MNISNQYQQFNHRPHTQADQSAKCRHIDIDTATDTGKTGAALICSIFPEFLILYSDLL